MQANTKLLQGPGTSGEFLLSVGTIGLSKCGGRKPSTLIQAARHNRRTIQAELCAHSHIDAARICLNETIAGPDTPEAVAALALKLMTDAGVNKLRKDHAQAIELLFSLAPGTTIKIVDYFRRCVAWARGRFGDANILSADIHMDESAPHCHVLILPLIENRMRGSDLISTLALVTLRKSFALEVAKEFGLKAPPGRMAGAMRGQAVSMVLQQLESTRDPVLTSPLWQTVKRDIERDPARFVAALGIEVKQAVDERTKRTMEEIYTSPGKGRKVIKAVNPIGFPCECLPNPIGIADCSDMVEVVNHIGFDKGHVSAEVQTLECVIPKPIGFAHDAETDPQNHRTLSCVGFAQNPSPTEAIDSTQIDGVRELSTVGQPVAVAMIEIADDVEYF